MRYLAATATLIFAVYAFLQGWSLLVVAAVLAFSVLSSTALLIPVAILLDGYFGNFTTLPLLSISAVAWFVATELLRPRLISIVQ